MNAAMKTLAFSPFTCKISSIVYGYELFGFLIY